MADLTRGPSGDVRRARLAACGIIVLAMLTLAAVSTPADASGDEPFAPGDADGDREAVAALAAARLAEATPSVPQASTQQVEVAERRLASLDARLDGAFAPQSDELCAERFWDQPGGTSSWIDVGVFGATSYCDGLMVLGILTYDEWYDSDLEAITWWIDTTGSEHDGCDGDNAVVIVAGGARLDAAVFAMPSCDPDSWTLTGEAVASREGDLDFLGVAFEHAALGSPSTIRFFGTASNTITTEIERFPTSGRVTLSGLEPEPEPEPEPVPEPSTALACPAGEVPSAGFVDTEGSAHRQDIDCLAWWEITRGVTAVEYAPARSITRAQMTAMMDRLLRATGDHPGSAAPAPFDDVEGHAFAEEIAVMAEFGVIRGVSADAFAPDRVVTRGQMASMIARLTAEGYGVELPVGEVPFDDIGSGSAHYRDVGRLVAAGITTGTGAGQYSPSMAVSRGQMASFLMRTAHVVIDRGAAEPPDLDAEPAPSLSVEPACAEIGEDFVVAATGLEPGADYDLVIDPVPSSMLEAGATMTADASGAVELPASLPEDLDIAAGTYTWQVREHRGAEWLASADFVIAESCP